MWLFSTTHYWGQSIVSYSIDVGLVVWFSLANGMWTEVTLYQFWYSVNTSRDIICFLLAYVHFCYCQERNIPWIAAPPFRLGPFRLGSKLRKHKADLNPVCSLEPSLHSPKSHTRESFQPLRLRIYKNSVVVVIQVLRVFLIDFYQFFI